MRRILALGMTIAAFGLAAPAYADNTQDEAFMLTLQNYRIHMDKNTALAQAASVCIVMKQGTTLDSVGIQLMKMHPDWTLDDAGHFAGAAIQMDCPDKMPT